LTKEIGRNLLKNARIQATLVQAMQRYMTQSHRLHGLQIASFR